MRGSRRPPGPRPPEVDRDEEESAFTPILRNVWNADRAVESVAFVDREGECIDYVSSVDPFEAKVAAAHALVLLDGLRETRERLDFGEPHTLEISCEARELWVRRVSEDYVIVLLARSGLDRVRVHRLVVEACQAFRREVAIDSPAWEHGIQAEADPGLRVSVRPAVGWGYAPTAFMRDDERIGITDVLGRWGEDQAGPGRVCFRVRTEHGQELTLTHDTENDGWAISQ